jgi:ornithine--oxo-acid transaminase
MSVSSDTIALMERYSARNYLPLPVVLSRGEGVWVEDESGRRYMDMLSAYSAVSHGHRHPRIIRALVEQAGRITLTSRAFHNDRLGAFCEKLSRLTGKQLILPMNTGAEAVETALKAARRWAYEVKKAPPGAAEVIVCAGNFHGRTITVVSFSSDEEYRRNFGPFTPGFKIIPYGDLDALRRAITPRTAAFLVEPIQGEGGIIIPPPGYLSEACAVCRENSVLFMADEIQTGLGRTGKMFGCDWEAVVPDVYILGKALGGGVLPVSAVAADESILGLFEPGSHVSTFGGNPLACAVACEAIDVLLEDDLAGRALEKGSYFAGRLSEIKNEKIVEVRGRGLLVGVELAEKARPYCERLMELGLLAKETHDNVIRFAPPLVINTSELDWALERIAQVLS